MLEKKLDIQPPLEEGNSRAPKLLYHQNAQYGTHFFPTLELFPIQ